MKTIESHLKKIYDDIIRVIPNTHNVDFSINRLKGGDYTWYHGFLHFGDTCVSFRSADELNTIVKSREILFRNFRGV